MQLYAASTLLTALTFIVWLPKQTIFTDNKVLQHTEAKQGAVSQYITERFDPVKVSLKLYRQGNWPSAMSSLLRIKTALH